MTSFDYLILAGALLAATSCSISISTKEPNDASESEAERAATAADHQRRLVAQQKAKQQVEREQARRDAVREAARAKIAAEIEQARPRAAELDRQRACHDQLEQQQRVACQRTPIPTGTYRTEAGA